MEVYTIVAMFKASGVVARKSRRAFLQVLQHHSGKKVYAPEYKVHMLYEGHMNIDEIEYQYEFGAVPGILNYYKKNIAKEAET